MAELSTLARPYARAAFEYARDAGTLALWSEQLAVVGRVTLDERVASLLGSPSQTAESKANAVIAICGDDLCSEAANFIRVLAANKRLPLLPEIHAQFEQFKSNQEKRVDVTVISAYELGEAAQSTLAEVLSKKLEREVALYASVDQGLLGGVLIRAGDLVIDGSVRGRLDKLSEAMNS